MKRYKIYAERLVLEAVEVEAETPEDALTKLLDNYFNVVFEPETDLDCNITRVEEQQ